MKRRGFLGFLGGAAAAGPAMARNAVASMPSGLGVAGSGLSWGSDAEVAPSCASTDGDWRLSEIARLKRVISGEKNKDEAEQDRINAMHRREVIISQHTAGLVSVSGVSKLRIFHRDMQRLNDEIDVARSRNYLSRLIHEAGIL